jgi:hypothetical protein
MSDKMQKCGCQMTAPELLIANVVGRDNIKSILIEDTGRGWSVTPYYPSSAGLGTDHITLQSAALAVERLMVEIRRDDTRPHDPSNGVTVTADAELAKLMRGTGI